LSKIVSAKTITVNHDQFIVLFVGKLLKREKGLDFLSEIIKIVMKKSSGIHFHIIGPEGDSEELLKSLVKRYPNNVEVLGFMNKNKLERQYAGADLFVLTSRKETFGLALLEAQSYGIPAICFDVGGPSDIVKERFQGRIIQRFDTEGFAAAVLKYYKRWQDKERYLKVKKLINKTINLRYNKRNIISKLAKLLVE
jgi:glycosyltransferase involved in cell wall biosynthesis